MLLIMAESRIPLLALLSSLADMSVETIVVDSYSLRDRITQILLLSSLESTLFEPRLIPVRQCGHHTI